MPTMMKQQSDEDETFRLHDLVVEEVSLVDRAANGRRFLMVKRDDADGGGTNAVQKTEEIDEVSKTIAEAMELLGKIADKQKEQDGPAAQLTDCVEKLVGVLSGTTEVAKAGRKLSSERATKLRDAVKALSAILDEVDPPTPPAEVTKSEPAPQTPPATDAADKQRIAKMEESITKLTDVVASYGKAIEKLLDQPGTSNVGVPDNDTTSVTKSATDVPWPLDMNDPPEQVK